MSNPGDKIQLANQEVEVIRCEKCDALMVNIDQSQLALGDIDILRAAGVRLSNPATKDPICIKCEIQREEEERINKRKVDSYMDRHDDDDDDSSFFGGSSGGGWGGFGGGGFSGGGASGGW